jgi:peptide chain release factor 2
MHFDVAELEKKLKELQDERERGDFWVDLAKAQTVGKRARVIENKLNGFKKLKSRFDDAALLVEMSDETGDASELEFIKSEMSDIKSGLEKIRLETLLRGKYDSANAVLTLHAGAGGTEAQDWVSMLFRMYSRYIERKGYSTKLLDSLDGEEAGLKSVTFTADGENAYGYLKAEMGVHRLVRISPFDSNKRRHTSFASLEVMPEIENDDEIVIDSEDLKVDTFRSGGAGGQHVNKTDSAVRITHLPTGIIVACQNERSQIQNREQALKMLKGRLIERRERERLEKEQSLKGDLKKIEWGSQIRSYVFCPYTLAKDHRTGFENSNITAVMDGDIDDFITEYLKKS